MTRDKIRALSLTRRRVVGAVLTLPLFASSLSYVERLLAEQVPAVDERESMQLAAIVETFLRKIPGLWDRERLVADLGKIVTASEFAVRIESLRVRIRKDFEDAEIFEVDGNLIALTEGKVALWYTLEKRLT